MRLNPSLKTLALAVTALTCGVLSQPQAQTLSIDAFAKDAGQLSYRPYASNKTVNFVAPASTGVTFSVTDITNTNLNDESKQGSLDVYTTNSAFGLCYGTASQVCPSSMTAATSTPSDTRISKGVRSVKLTPVGGERIISVTAYASISGTEFAIDKFKGKGQ